MQSEIDQLSKQVRYLRYYAITSSLAIIIFLFSAFRQQAQTFDLIRARGIIIEDSAGRDRILIGAPIPASPYRVRTDTALVRKHWGKNYKNTKQFMEWYSNYYHGAMGMVVLNEAGFDRVAVGDKLPDPNTGKRMFEAAGMTFNDKEGWERGGLGVNTTKEGRSRAAFGLDNDNGEAVHLVALEDGTKGQMIGGENDHLMIGMAKKDGEFFRTKRHLQGSNFSTTMGNCCGNKR